MAHSMAQGILTQDEETKLREFRDRLALEKASRDRLMLDARLVGPA